MLERMVAGAVPAKHHTALRDPHGRPRYEECLTRQGFDGPYTILYHEHRPHLQRLGPPLAGFELPQAAGDGRLARRHYKSFELERLPGPPVSARLPLLFNPDVVLSAVFPTEADPVLFSNGDADDLYFILEGGGVLRSAFGELAFEALDYVCVPRGVAHRLIPDPALSQYWLSVECFSGLGLPRQWRNDVGQLRMDAPYCHRDFRRSVFSGPQDDGVRDLLVKRAGAFHGFVYETPPFDVVGFDGSVYPFAFRITDFQPRVGLVHLPPTWHGTFATRGSLICSFVPRPVDFHPDAIPCPYPHASVDVDEVIFYGRGEFTSRRGIAPGSVSHHPAGVAHGPHPGAYEGSIGTSRTDELAVMLDCYQPLEPTPRARRVEDTGYHESFFG